MLRSKDGGSVALRVSPDTQLALESRAVCTLGDRGELPGWGLEVRGRRRQLWMEDQGRTREGVG